YTHSAVLIGFAIGGEGIFAVLVPYWVGALSDHLPARVASRFGRRTLFLILMAPIMAAALVVVPFLHGYIQLAAAAFVFFAALHGYLTPLWALLVDAVPKERHGQVQGVRGMLHSFGLAYGLVAGGLLFSLWRPLPFLIAAALILAATAITKIAAPTEAAAEEKAEAKLRDVLRIWRRFEGRPAVPWFLLANALWSGGVDGIRPFIFIFATVVLGINVAQTSLALLLVVAGLGLGALIIGRLGDRYGHETLLEIGGAVTGITMLLGFFVRDLPGATIVLLVSGLGAAALIALPYPLFASLIGEGNVGRDTGLYILTFGVGRIVAPLLVGAAIDLAAPLFPELHGYPVMWPMAGILALLGVLALRKSMSFARATLPGD
ncbi:MAG TPA: MFS transporter, partial [Longimicrobiales bacterium]|nr:MFS transporter [Longimicrobiales bacterium]